jgi:uncharacterized protein (UPF0548 family)
MFSLSKPSEKSIREFISSQSGKAFSYAETGSTRGKAPHGYAADRNRVRLGADADAFQRAKDAVRQWKVFDMPWITLCWPDTPIKEGATVAVLISHYGFWSLNACRIVYVIDEHGTTERFGFAYGTLPNHGEFGEERFTVEYNTDDRIVWYDIYAYSRPGRLARLGYPLSRSLQKRFARDSMKSMQEAVTREA